MQDYKMVVRSVYGGQSNGVAQSLEEAQETQRDIIISKLNYFN